MICLDDLKDPRLLPCIHLFCLGCLEQYCRDKLPGDPMPCPVCKEDFDIPKTGVRGLTVRAHGTELALSARCQRGHYCTEHKHERINMYCFECGINVCSTCCCESHRTHKSERIEKFAEQFSKSIDDEIDLVTSRIECYRGATAKVEAENNKTLDNIKTIERQVKKRNEYLVEKFEKFKQLLGRQANDVLQELQSLKSAAEEEVNSHTETLHMALAKMESSKTSLVELRSKGSPNEITQAAGGLLVIAEELLQTYVSPTEYIGPSYKFTPVNIDELNFIGHVTKVEDSGNVTKCSQLLTFCAFRLSFFNINKTGRRPHGL